LCDHELESPIVERRLIVQSPAELMRGKQPRRLSGSISSWLQHRSEPCVSLAVTYQTTSG
jgi:hypothetical protein